MIFDQLTHTLIALSLLLLFSASCNYRDEAVIKIPATDSITAQRLHEEAYKLLLSNPDSALSLPQQKETTHRLHHNFKRITDCYYAIIYVHGNVTLDSASTHKYADSALLLSYGRDNEKLRYKAYSGYGYYSLIENYPMASLCYINALRTQPKPVDASFFLNTTGALADVLYYQQNPKAASDFYEPVIRANEKMPASAMKVSTFLNAVSYADKESDEEKAGARAYLFAARKVSEARKDNGTNTLLFNNLASCYLGIGISDGSCYFAQKALHEWKINPTYLDNPAEPFVILAHIYVKKGQLLYAGQILRQFEHSVHRSVFQTMNIEARYYDTKYKVAKHEGSLHIAFNALEHKSDLNDLLYRISNQQPILEYIADIKRLAADKTIAIKNSQLKKQRLYTIGLVVVSLLLLLLVAIIYWYWRNQKRLDTEKWQHIQEMKASESQAKLFEERSRIAREMHDDLGSTLTSTLMALELAKQKPGDQMPLEMINRSTNLLSEQINEVIWNMNIKNDNIQSLCDYILRFASPFLKDASIAFSWQVHVAGKNITVDGQFRRRVYLSVKELINNIVKHSGATKVQLHISYRQGMLNLGIEDNGIGLSVKLNTNAGSGCGLANIKRNIESLNGQVKWQYREPGTNVEISIPL